MSLDNKIEKEVIELIENGSDRNVIEGFLLFKGVAKKDAMSFLKNKGLIGRKTFRDRLYSRCIEGVLGDEEFETLIADESENTKKHLSHYNEIRKAMNEIHLKYGG